MTKALRVKGSGELFRLASVNVGLHNLRDGVIVDCYNALLREGKRTGKRTYDKLVKFTWDWSKYDMIETSFEKLRQAEIQRAKELVCWKFHRHKCGKPPYERLEEKVYKSVTITDWEQEMFRVGSVCLEYLETPGKFDRTRQAVLAMDLKSLVSYLKTKRERGLADGKGGETTGAGVPGP